MRIGSLQPPAAHTATAVVRGFTLCFFGATAWYGALVASPFAYHQFIRPNLLTPLVWAVTFYDALFLGVLSVTVLTLVPDLTERGTRTLALAYLVVAAAASAALFVFPLGSWLRPAPWTLAASAATLAPVAWLAGLDIVRTWSAAFREPRPATDPVRLLSVGIVSAAVVWGSYAGIAAVGAMRGGAPVSTWMSGAVRSLWLHGSAFAMLTLLLVFVAMLARRSRRRGPVEFAAVATVFAVGVFVVSSRLVMPAIGLHGAGALAFAGVFAAVASAAWCGIALRLATHRAAGGSGVELFFLPLRPATAPPWSMIAIPAVAYAAVAAAGRMDWGFVLQKSGVLFVWMLAWAAALRLVRVARPARLSAAGLVPLALMGLQLGPGAGAASVEERAARAEAYAAIDASFRLIDDAVARRPGAPVGLFEYLLANTNVDAKVAIAPAPIEFASPGEAGVEPEAPHPHIFLFVVDSLRPDYLSPYNDRVTFTPAIDALAREGLVFRNAFTRYAGTGLAVPAIWAGSLLPHRQYVTPFTPMNALARLVDRHGYRAVVSLDSIMTQLQPRAPNWRDVYPQGVGNDGDLCEIVSRMRQHLDDTSADDRPVFGYALPQNVHLSYIQNHPGPGLPVEGFDPAAAAETRNLDACLGSFVEHLRARGLYDDSIVIVTSDHGDSLGEGGRWGHSYTGFPEIFRIPLIVRLPASLRGRWDADLDAVAFSTDITPTLYALLGHRVVPPGSVAGVPLVSPSGQTAPDRRRESFLVASSYGAVYGVLSDNGRRLYVLDTINVRDYAWDLSAGVAAVGGRRVPLTEAERSACQQVIAARVAEIAAYFKFHAEL